MQYKPREKLALYGPKAMEDHELFEIILGRGTKKENVFHLVERILKTFNRDELLNIQEVKTFQEFFGTGFVQSCQLISVFEIGKRLLKSETSSNIFRSSEQVYERVKDMQSLKKEYVRGLYLNTRYKLIHDEIISIGSLDSNVLHPREVFRPAIEYGAYAVIIIHNHPSGDPTPSQEDITATQTLMKIGNILKIPLLDHLIIGKERYTSLNKDGVF